MENEILLTICCITYNHEEYIEDALKGFLNQKTSFKYEIFIHDDASTDKTTEIIKKYEKKYPHLIKVIYQKENQYSKGKYVSGYLFEKAKGKYLAFCEGDDYWINENKLQKQVDFLEKNREYVATYHNVLLVDENKERIKQHQKIYPFYKEHKITKKDISNIYICGQTASIVCRNFWKNWTEEQKNTFVQIKAPGDGRLSLIFTLIGEVYFFEEIMSCYRFSLNGGSWSAQTKTKNSALQHYNFLLELQKLGKKMFNFDYKIDINNFIIWSLKIFLKKLTYDDFKIFLYFVKKRNSAIDTIIYFIKKIKNRKKKYWSLLNDEKKYLKGTIYEK